MAGAMADPGAATIRVDQLIALTERLTELLLAETRAFEARRPQDAAATSSETVKLANLYRHESARVRLDPGLVAGAPVARRERLVAATQAFDAVLARHGRALHAAKTITEGLVQAIAKEIASHRQFQAGYGPRAKSRTGDACAITLNRRA